MSLTERWERGGWLKLLAALLINLLFSVIKRKAKL